MSLQRPAGHSGLGVKNHVNMKDKVKIGPWKLFTAAPQAESFWASTCSVESAAFCERRLDEKLELWILEGQAFLGYSGLRLRNMLGSIKR